MPATTTHISVHGWITSAPPLHCVCRWWRALTTVSEHCFTLFCPLLEALVETTGRNVASKPAAGPLCAVQLFGACFVHLPPTTLAKLQSTCGVKLVAVVHRKCEYNQPTALVKHEAKSSRTQLGTACSTYGCMLRHSRSTASVVLHLSAHSMRLRRFAC
eukprot:568522-Pleurochrysis_carterae.AAC.1